MAPTLEPRDLAVGDHNIADRNTVSELVTPEYDGLPVPPWVQPDWRCRAGNSRSSGTWRSRSTWVRGGASWCSNLGSGMGSRWGWRALKPDDAVSFAATAPVRPGQEPPDTW